LKYKCSDFEEMRRFLATCRVADTHREDKGDYWQPPEEFELTRKGDCVDFALWSWRQLLQMGYDARFAGGKAGRLGGGHAWVTYEHNGRAYLLEPQMWAAGSRMPRIYTLRYHPTVSVSWDGEKVSYYEHEKRRTDPPMWMVPHSWANGCSYGFDFGLEFCRACLSG
jgi:hypothetical protein